jgi:mRNA-degrading endonuclease RelE of RelBE toxin-antitoxin system
MKKGFALLENPRPHDSEELRGYPFLRNDAGEYRIIYDVKGGDTLRLILVGKRNDAEAYRQL